MRTRTRFSLVSACLIFLVLFPVLLLAQSDECSIETPEKCRVDLNLFCEGGERIPLAFSLNLDTFQTLDFTTTFSAAPPSNRLPLVFVDGEVESGNVREGGVTRLQCNGSVCTGSISIAKLQELSARFDLDQAVVTVVLRKRTRFGKDVCIGKFVNDPDVVASNLSDERQVCTLEPTPGNESVTAEGFFEPGGYGTDGVPRFHLSIEGLDTTKRYRACSVTGTGRYEKVFSFRPVELATAVDSEIYGSLSAEAQAEFDSNRELYSYELRRSLESLSTGDLSTSSNRFFPSLSLINKSVSATTAKSTSKKWNKRTRKLRRERRRKKKLKSSRELIRVSRDVEISATRRQEVLGWLNFDPLGATVVISPNCKSNVAENAIGTLVCGNAAENPNRKCERFTFADDTLGATACREVTSDVGKLVIRARDDAPQDLTVCLNGVAFGETVSVTDENQSLTEISYAGKLQITDSAELVASTIYNDIPSFVLLPTPVSGVTSVALSATGDCNAVLGTVSF